MGPIIYQYSLEGYQVVVFFAFGIRYRWYVNDGVRLMSIKSLEVWWQLRLD